MRASILALALSLAGCGRPVARCPTGEAPECAVRRVDEPAVVVDPAAPDRPDPVWGVADLHAHPANHLAYGGAADGTGGMFYGHPEAGRREHGRVWIGPEDSCDGETHLGGSADSARRITQGLVFNLLGGDANRPHTAMYDRSAFDDVPYVCGSGTAFSHWPHASDLFHQQMHVEAIRRAYERGLRLMFASFAENQSITTVMGITLAPGPILLDPARDLVSLESQMAYVEHLVQENDDWMAIATSPTQARDIIRSGRLAIVLSLEMDYLPIEEVRRLHERGVRHIIPIHTADTPVGGAAAYNPIFNMHTALLSRAFGASEFEFFTLEADSCVATRMAPPYSARLELGLLLFPQPLEGDAYLALGYEPQLDDECASDPIRDLHRGGHHNVRGLRDVAYIRELMRMGMIVDVVHMSHRSAADTMAEGERQHYPIIDSHTGVGRAGALVEADNDIPLGIARRIYRNEHGVIGIGTGRQGRVLDTLFSATGSPFATLQPGVALRLRAPRLEDYDDESWAPLAVGDRIVIGGVPGEPAPDGFVRVELCDRSDPLEPTTVDVDVSACTPPPGEPEGSCTSSIVAAVGARPIASLTYHARRSEYCEHDPTRAPNRVSWAAIEHDDGERRYFTLPFTGPTAASHTVADALPLGRRACPLDLDCTDVGTTDGGDPIPAAHLPGDAVVEGHRLLRVRLRPGEGFSNRVRGDGLSYAGTEVVATIELAGHEDVELVVNAGGTVVEAGELWAYHLLDDDSGLPLVIESIELEMRTIDHRRAPWNVTGLVVEEVEDPIVSWVRGYAELQAEIAVMRGPDEAALDGPVVLAIGTDLNGFVAQFPSTGLVPAPDDPTCEPFEVCDAYHGDCVPLHLRDRGLASYAMLGDFFDVVPAADRIWGTHVADSLFSSAEATLRAWDLAEARAPEIRP